MGAPTILVIEDEERMRRVFDLVLRPEGYRLMLADSGEAGIALVNAGEIDLVLTDFQMGKVSGLDVLDHVTKKCPEVPVVIITGFGTVKSAVEAIKKGAFDYISKPIDNEELKIVVKRALQGKVLKNEVVKLLGDINHDIKNLLTPVVMGTELLESEIKQFYKRRPAVEAAETEASQKICNEVIDMLRDTARRIQDRTKEIADYVKGLSAPPHFVTCAVADVVDTVLRTLRLVAEGRGIVLLVEGLDRLPPIVADERGLYNVFFNLINNAIEAVPPGGRITIRGEATSGTDSIVLTVADTGRGMPPKIRESLFIAGTISRKPGGTGLGTKIVKDVVDAHGGQIAVETKEGEGTTFVIQLPLRPPAAGKARE